MFPYILSGHEVSAILPGEVTSPKKYANDVQVKPFILSVTVKLHSGV